MSEIEVLPQQGEPAQVASSSQYWWWRGDVALPQTIDDIERDFGPEIYDRMYNDPTVAGITDGLRTSAVERGLSILPGMAEPKRGRRPSLQGLGKGRAAREREAKEEAEEYALWKRCADYCRAALAGMDDGGYTVMDLAWDAFYAIGAGHRVAEARTRLAEEGDFRLLEVFDSIRCKPRRNYAFVVDPGTNDFRGLVALQPGGYAALWTGVIPRLSALRNAVDPEKLFVLTLNPKDGDPRGVSTYRAIYAAWREKQVGRVEDLKNIGGHAGGKVSIIMPENTGRAGNTGVSSEADFLSKGEMFVNGAVGVFPAGTQVTVHYPPATGPFTDFMDRRDREIALGISKQIRATLEAKHGSRADSGDAVDKEDKVVALLRRQFCEALLRLLRPLVRRNLGPEYVARMPIATLASTAAPDFAPKMAALTRAGFKLHKSQFEGLDQRMDLPERAEGWQDDAEEALPGQERDDEETNDT